MAADLPPLPPAPVEIGATSFWTGVHVSGRVHAVTYVVRSQITSISVEEKHDPAPRIFNDPAARHYLITVFFAGGAPLEIRMPDFDHARSAMATLGCGDLALSGLAQGPA